jgi:hypothetical protein
VVDSIGAGSLLRLAWGSQGFEPAACCVAGWGTERVVERDGRARSEGRRRRVGKKENARASTERMNRMVQKFILTKGSTENSKFK